MNFPDDWNQLLPELDQQPDDLTVTKTAWDAFHDSGLAEQLHARGTTWRCSPRSRQRVCRRGRGSCRFLRTGSQPPRRAPDCRSLTGRCTP
ncbi:isochorismatase family protein [Clavibacter michiganensis]|uniref:isochorismatase family protein n=1 Tax=Clavibacter michiganensis TaxID=28447 RepID=UPI00374E0329